MTVELQDEPGVPGVPGAPDETGPPPRRRRPTLIAARCVRLAVAGLCVMTVLGLAGSLGNRLDLATHFQVQYLFGGLGCLALCLALRSWRWAVVAALATSVAASRVVPWYLPASSSARAPLTAKEDERRIRVLLVNVLTTNGDHAAVESLTQEWDPDILVLQEVDDVWLDGLPATSDRLTHQVAAPRGDNFGIALFSRQPLEAKFVRYFGPSGIPSIVAELVIDGERVTVVTTHPLPPVRSRSAAQRDEQLAEVGAHVSALDGPVLLIGDLNATMWSTPYLQLIRDTGLHDARRGFGVLPTWSMKRPWFMRIPIDHCLHSKHFRVVHCGTGLATGSDHLPLLVELELAP